ncbi:MULTISPECIES: ABC transporter permease [Paenibacillus]|jgi:putative ABC transport system permease protein|uniref:ABC transporter permease n=1 Tax=Paenibacillus polymyxa TaxID=1406 RepID=A0A8I1IY96_PAEPO|nr:MULTISPECIES: FtsX-like permease family protein [Paenibacillus]KAF6571368.1 ABC transporter permease [Paenibacillus sp. EKM206P]KAF6586369.1 ABC transporter permease [Paenibacillus sp. EKM205P]MBM0635328.1 ABC transporter permease [Paenibacillus polymyxa]UMY54152.1 ABC transporter permease [Paenibacillus peoriae]
MIKVKNKKVIRNLSEKSFKVNKARNLFAIVAIALTSLLFTTLFTMGIGAIENLQRATMRQVGGDGHAVLKYITDDEFNHVKDHPLIKEIAYNRILSDGVKNDNFLKRRTEFWYYDDVGMKLGFIELKEGHKPVAENEVIADSKTLQLLDVPLKIGAPLRIKLNIRGKEVQRDFVLSGWWKSDPVVKVGQIFASKAYVDAHAKELQSTYKKDHFYTGVICAYMMFDNSFDLRGKLNKVITESGYSLDEDAPNYIASNVNWAYISTNFSLDTETIIALTSALLLIIFTGYLIIYNIFQISVMRDIRFYGLLKTIGTSSKQIRRIIRRQALILSVLGIPIGLIAGFFIGKSLVPFIINMSNFNGTVISVSPNPWIFIGSALFALITVMISTFKPGRVASSVSPIEAVRYTSGANKNNGKLKKSTGGAKIHLMARSNLGRNKKRTILVVISLSLSLVLLNTVFTLSQSFDMDKFLSKFNDTDFLIAHAGYFQVPSSFSGHENETTESFIKAVQAQPGFEEGGRLYGSPTVLTAENTKGITDETQNTDARGNFLIEVYGLEELPLHRLQLIDGELDFKKLASGKYILEGVELDDNDKPYMKSTHHKVGENVTLHSYVSTSDAPPDREYITQKFTVLGHVGIKYSNSDRFQSYSFYLPANIYKSLVKQPAVMSYAFNVSSIQEASMQSFLKRYTETIEPMMSYESKITSRDALSGMQTTVIMIGGLLSLIIGLIGILNFINAILTSILTRRKEFAMLQSIGMTKRQLRGMLIYEGLYYVGATSLTSILLAVLFSLLIVKPFCSLLWLLSYHFIIWPLLVSLPLLLLLGILIPAAVYSMNNKQSIVERLRGSE